MANEPAPSDVPADLAGTLMEHSRQLGAAVERLDAADAAKAAYMEGIDAIRGTHDRLETLAQRQEEIATELAALRVLPTVQKEAAAVGAAADPTPGADPGTGGTDPPEEKPNVGTKKRGPFAWLHDVLG